MSTCYVIVVVSRRWVGWLVGGNWGTCFVTTFKSQKEKPRRLERIYERTNLETRKKRLRLWGDRTCESVTGSDIFLLYMASLIFPGI